MTAPRWSVGSSWMRWDPHLHAPGTLRNDQFGNDWDGYLRRIDEARPTPCALGITDYFTLRTYKEVLHRRQAGALQSVALVFPNVELRLTIETKERQGINLHLLVSPDDPEHVVRMEEKLAQLFFLYRGERFPCTEEGLLRLGRVHRGEPSLAEEAALREGANQFKVELSELAELLADSWVHENVLVAVAGGKDGLGGIAKDASFHAQREELGRRAQIVFSGQPSDRLYWLGQHDEFSASGHSLKPCLHGCDAHSLDTVLEPTQERRCWIRGQPTFDGLRQTLVEPERRVHIGAVPPHGAFAGDTIRALRLRNAAWAQNAELLLNDGLVTIIGAKGSGKTALADLIAFAANADEIEPGPASFLAKAGRLIEGLEAEIEWGDATQQASTVPRDWLAAAEPRARYLSQHFVERLCAPEGLAEPLVEEIERVVFSAIAEEDRLQCASFSELREVMLACPASEQASERDAIRARTRLIAEETKELRSRLALQTRALDTERDRKRLEKELAAIPIKASDEKVKAHKAAALKLQKLKEGVAAEERKAQALREVLAEIRRQIDGAAASLQDLRRQYGALLDAGTWASLQLRIEGTALEALVGLERETRERITALRERGTAPSTAPNEAAMDAQAPEGLQHLTAETERLARELGLDERNAKRRVELERRLAVARVNEEKARAALAHAQSAPVRIREAQAERLERYAKVFAALVSEERALEQLYEPLSRRIAEDPRLSKLGFVVQRVVDLEAWANRGETLLDLRKPPFSGRGALADSARGTLLPNWTSGTPEQVRLAMEAFIEQHSGAALEALAQGSTPLDFGEWLFSTDHIRVRYGIQYEGVEIDRLSPGTRGVVLLTLYLGLDEWDLRPLVIDQPEENLDPRSVYTDLVPFFREAAKRRQIIMVTHNANLVVNTDSDQVIVAEARRTSSTGLPQVTYSAGGLEDAEIRSRVCLLLEGGEEAFRKRGQRYGVYR